MKFSIITVNYNNKEGLRKTIESVIHQTFRDFEFIVIDGGSTDGSDDVLKEYDAQIDYWVSEPDGGIYQGMNKGIKKATGEYLNFMNSGDCFYASNILGIKFDKFTLDEFLDGVEELVSKIDTFKENADMNNYAIVVHSLKSDAKINCFWQ